MYTTMYASYVTNTSCVTPHLLHHVTSSQLQPVRHYHAATIRSYEETVKKNAENPKDEK